MTTFLDLHPGDRVRVAKEIPYLAMGIEGTVERITDGTYAHVDWDEPGYDSGAWHVTNLERIDSGPNQEWGVADDGPESLADDAGTDTPEEVPEAASVDSVDFQDPFPVGAPVVATEIAWDHDEKYPGRIGTVETCPAHEQGADIRSAVGIDPDRPNYGWTYFVRQLRKAVVYISGPMTGYEDYNFPAFNIAAEALRARGWEVLNPADKGVIDGWNWADYLRYDLTEIAKADAIYTLPGWRKSKGARLEMHVAEELGIEWINADGDLPPIFDEVEESLSALAEECETDRLPKGEVRVTSSTGGQKGSKPERYDLIPWDAMDTVARVYEFGSRKYDDHNWRRGYPFELSISSAFRHLVAFTMGEDNDPESGQPHPAHAVFHLLALIAWIQDGGYSEFDTRYKIGELS